MIPAGDAETSFKITVKADEDARIARVFHDGEWPGDPAEAGALLDAVCRRWPKDVKADVLVLCGGFLRFRWPDRLKRWDIGDNLNPSKATLDMLYQEAEKCFRQVFDGRIRAKLRRQAGVVTFGADSHYLVDDWYFPHAELVFAMDPDTGEAWPTGKSYPNPRQQQGLVRIADLESHFVRAAGKDLMLLSCHDLSLFSPRSYHNARGWRRETIERFRQMARERKPELIVWHPHKSDTPRTWIPGLGGLRKELPGVSYISAGMYHNDGASPRASMDSVLKHTKNVPAVDLIVRRKKRDPDD
ncbi:MAG: hypothetical protein A4E28_03242 [Methanocella sp. PtaU1.Bin125]|nr:MAG: hypothetical protein A4E28_03242 [Methanocella sp. PtaU1.Bin125]